MASNTVTYSNIFVYNLVIQVHKLHRVYKIQRELMSDFRSTIQAKYLVSGGTSESSLFSSDVSSKDDKRIQHISDLALLDFSYHRPSMASIDVTQSCYNSLSGKTLQSTCVSSKHDIKSNNQESLNSKRKKRKSRLLDLELCADEYINDENELQRENEVPNGANFLFNRSNDVYHYRDRGIYHGGENVGYNNLLFAFE